MKEPLCRIKLAENLFCLLRPLGFKLFIKETRKESEILKAKLCSYQFTSFWCHGEKYLAKHC